MKGGRFKTAPTRGGKGAQRRRAPTKHARTGGCRATHWMPIPSRRQTSSQEQRRQAEAGSNEGRTGDGKGGVLEPPREQRMGGWLIGRRFLAEPRNGNDSRRAQNDTPNREAGEG